MTNPCFCGCSLKTASLIIALIDMILAAICGVIVLVLGGITIGALAGAEVKSDDETARGAALGLFIGIFIVLLLVCFAKFYLGWILKRGSDQEDLRKCRIWFIVSCVLLVLGILGTIGSFTKGEPSTIICNILGLVYEAFCLWVVYEFMQELKSGRTFDAGVVHSTQKA